MLGGSDILEYLGILNSKLSEAGIHADMIMCGGAVMAAVYNARGQTKDIDAVFAPSMELHRIIGAMAEEYGLPPDWLNDGVKGFVDTRRMGFDDFAEYSNLTVRVPDTESLLAMKLASARFDSLDLDDALFLMGRLGIGSAEELYGMVERHMDPSRLTPASWFFIQEAYARFREQARQASGFEARRDPDPELPSDLDAAARRARQRNPRPPENTPGRHR